MSLFGMFSSKKEEKEDSAIDRIFNDFDSQGGPGVLYRILKDSKCILGGTASLLDHISRTPQESDIESTAIGRSIADGLEDSRLAIFCHLSKSENLLNYIRMIISQLRIKEIGRERLNLLSLSIYEKCGINEVILIDFSETSEIIIEGLDIYIVSDDHYLEDSTKVLTFDVLTSYIKLEGETPKDRVFYTNYQQELTERKANMLPEGAQEYYYSKMQSRNKIRINGTYNYEYTYLENITVTKILCF